ncbi:MAG: hypothetical protein INR71_13250, partial [Terriglobus roseus]|nr:hypothetical protein [Terriglobus roseus]
MCIFTRERRVRYDEPAWNEPIRTRRSFYNAYDSRVASLPAGRRSRDYYYDDVDRFRGGGRRAEAVV